MQMVRACRAMIGIVALGVAGCSPSTPAPAVPLRVAHELWAGYYPLDALSADSSPNALVRATVVEPSDRLFAEFAAGMYDGIAASVVDLIRLQQTASDLRIVGCTDESAGADAIVSRAGVTSVNALKGRRIGVSAGTFAELLLDAMLARANLSRSDVILVDADAGAIPDLLRRGEIDAGETWEPYLSTLPSDSFPVRFSTRDAPGLIVQCLAFHDRVIRADPARVRSLINAIVQTGDSLVRAPDVLRERAARGVGRPLAEMPVVRGVRWLSLDENRRLLGSGSQGAELPQRSEPHIRFLAANGALRSRPDVEAMIRNDLLPPATPARP